MIIYLHYACLTSTYKHISLV